MAPESWPGEAVVTEEVDLVQWLTAQRKHVHMSQAQVAEAMGCSQSHISRIERGVTDPYFRHLQRYARAIGTRISYAPPPPVVEEDES